MGLSLPTCPDCGRIATGISAHRCPAGYEWRSRVLLPAAGETCEWSATGEGPLCGQPAVKMIFSDGVRYGVCASHLQYADGAQLAYEAVTAGSRNRPCPVLRMYGFECGFCAEVRQQRDAAAAEEDTRYRQLALASKIERFARLTERIG